LSRKDLNEVEVNLEMVKKIIEKDPENSEVNLRKAIVKEKRIVLVTARNLNDANWKNIAEIKSIYASCKKDGIPFLLLTSSSRAKINAFRKKNNFNVPVFLNDETGLKAIARSNPSMMVIEKGIVKGKFPHRSIPSYEWLKKNTFKK
jgi:Cys-tRNA synthase (O-phospho-L-seryl-tRNA:Cys-tRNA synthase)